MAKARDYRDRRGELTDAAIALYHLGTPEAGRRRVLVDKAVIAVATFYQLHADCPYMVDCDALAERVFVIIDHD